MTKKTLLALSASLLMGAAPAAAQTTPYGGYTGTEPLTSYGTRMMESYDVAVRLTVDENDQGLVGSQITGVRIPFPDDIDHLIEAQAWISKSLELTDYSFTPDIEVKSFTPGPGFIDVTFDSPYTITSEGVYVGYSFEMDEKVSKPITTISGTNPNYFYLDTTLAYYEGFLASVMKQLSNARFVASAPEKVVANARAKQADAEAKITAIREQLAALESGK